MTSSIDLLPRPFAWITIPEGDVTMILNDESVTLRLPVYEISKYPITDGQYLQFMNASGYSNNQWWTPAGIICRDDEKWVSPDLGFYKALDVTSWLPVVGVSWYEAVAFCNWFSNITGDSITLPTSAQWQRAAQGDDGRRFPWGNMWSEYSCNNALSGYAQEMDEISPVTHYQDRGASPFGVADMIGNKIEWCLTDKNGSDDVHSTYSKVMRGGSWNEWRESDFEIAQIKYCYPSFRDRRFGFRIIRKVF